MDCFELHTESGGRIDCARDVDKVLFEIYSTDGKHSFMTMNMEEFDVFLDLLQELKEEDASTDRS